MRRTDEYIPTNATPQQLEHAYQSHLANYGLHIQETITSIDAEAMAGYAGEVIDRISLMPTSQILDIEPETKKVAWSSAVSYDANIDIAERYYDQMRARIHATTRGVYVRPAHADSFWKQRVENDFERHRINGVLVKLDEACRKGDFKSDPNLSLLIARLPVNNQTAFDLSNLWLTRTLKIAGETSELPEHAAIVAGYSRVYSALCDQTGDGVPRAPIDMSARDKNFHDSKTTILKVKQLLAEQRGYNDVAEIIEEIGASFYPPQRNSATGEAKPASLRELRASTPKPSDIEIARQKILDAHPAEQAVFSFDRKKLLVTTAVLATGASILANAQSAAAMVEQMDGGTQTVSPVIITQVDAFLGQGMRSSIPIVVNVPVRITKPTYDVAAQIQATTEPAPEVSAPELLSPANAPLPDAAAIAQAIVTTTQPDTHIAQVLHAQVPEAQPADPNKPATREQMLTRLAGLAGVNAVTAGITNEAQTSAPTIASVNPLLSTELNQKLQTYNSELASADPQAVDTNALSVRIAELTAALQNPSTLDALDDQTKQQILTGANTAYASIYAHQSAQVLANYATGKFGNWNGFTPDQQKIVAGLLTTIDLSLMSPSDLQTLMNTINPPAIPPTPDTAGANQAPQAPSNSGEATSSADLIDKALTQLSKRPNWTNRAYIMQALIKDGYSLEQASGIVGNFDVEDADQGETQDIDPTIKQFGGGPGRGFGQWGSWDQSGDRFGHTPLADGSFKHGTLRWYASQHGLSWDSIEAQTGFLIWELHNTEPDARPAVMATTNAYDAATAFMNSYERPAVRVTGERGTNARKAYRTVTKLMKEIADANKPKPQPAPANTGNTQNPGVGELSTNTQITYPGTDRVLQIAQNVTDVHSNAYKVISTGGTLHNKCDHLATAVWGYFNSGYDTALVHWNTLQADGKVHTDREPAVGAFVYYDNHLGTGHIAVYLGNGMVLSNDVGPGNKGKAVIVPASEMETGSWHLTYLGWSDPIARGDKYATDLYNSL